MHLSMEKISEMGLFNAIEQGLFAEIKRPKEGGKGLEGVTEKGPDYWNPAEEMLKDRLGLQ